MKTITLNVTDEIANTFEQLTEQERLLAIETLSRLLKDKRTLFEVMDDISEYARRQGLTEETLKNIMKKK